MNTLSEDREEVGTAALARWVQRKRRQYGIRASEPACWFVEVQQEFYKEGTGKVVDSDTHVEWLGRSPGDALFFAELYASARAAVPRGTGRWVLDVYGDGISAPRMLVVRPHHDVKEDVDV